MMVGQVATSVQSPSALLYVDSCRSRATSTQSSPCEPL